jgi:hypothetical protein
MYVRIRACNYRFAGGSKACTLAGFSTSHVLLHPPTPVAHLVKMSSEAVAFLHVTFFWFHTFFL